jgi:hypothetical protein
VNKKVSLGLVLILEAVAFIIGIISAIGSTCPTLDPRQMGFQLGTNIPDPAKQPVVDMMTNLQFVFITTTTLTYVAAIASGVLIWALLTRKEWFYKTTLIVNVVGAITGYIPYFLVKSAGGGSPSIMRAVVYTITLLVLLLPFIKSPLAEYIQEKKEIKTSFGSDITNMSIIAVSVGLITLTQLIIVPSMHSYTFAHVLGFYLDFIAIQLYGGLFCIFVGIIGIISGRLIIKKENSFQPTRS